MVKQKWRMTIQAAAALLQNADWRGFFTGKISQSSTKAVCVPGLNCYSCPGAVGACPIGSLQNTLSAYRFRFPYYVLGLLIFFGALCGRLICGFLCPFGFLQDLLFKLPFPKKLRTFRGDRTLRKVKYLVLIVMVIILPICIKLTPVFCKYLCPSGTLSGILLVLADHKLVSQLGVIFSWKAIVLLSIVILGMMISRPFCKYLCPLGAFYAPFNKVSIVRMTVDAQHCTGCKACAHVCDMCVDPSLTPNHTECIRCGKCTTACPTGALKLTTVFNRDEEHKSPA